MKFVDASKVGSKRKTQDGYLVADVLTARTGIQLYSASELGMARDGVVRVYRPEEQVFDKASLASYAHKPVTDNHPEEAVNAGNWKELSAGFIGDEIARDGEYVRVPLVIMDQALIDKVEAGKVELSAGYICDVEFTEGKTKDGQTYDAIQTNIRINHVAVVDRGRAGEKARIGDGAISWGATPIDNLAMDERKYPMTKNIMVDGLMVETTDAGAAAIDKLQKAIEKLTSDAATITNDHKAAVAAKDQEIGRLQVELKQAKDAIPDGAAIDKMVADRVALLGKAKAIAPELKLDGMTDAEIKQAVVITKLGDAIVKDASAATIDGMFIALTVDGSKIANDPLQGFTPAAAPHLLTGDDTGQEKYEQRLRDAWKAPKVAGV